MKTIVRFRSARGEFALPVECVTAVRRAGELVLMPAPQPGIAGVIAHDDGLLPVLSVLGEPGQHVIVLHVDDHRFGLLVEEVTAVRRVADDEVGPPPQGQEGSGVSGALVDGGVVLVLDPVALRARLAP